MIIGIFHPVVIKCEYYFTEKVWPAFLLCGIVFCICSLLVESIIGSAALAVTGFTMLWSIGELKEQTQRVRKGWFPANPKRTGPVCPTDPAASEDKQSEEKEQM